MNKVKAVVIRNWGDGLEVVIYRSLHNRRYYNNITGWSVIRVQDVVNSLPIQAEVLLHGDDGNLSIIYDFEPICPVCGEPISQCVGD